MEAVHDERTDSVFPNMLEHGWAYQKLANQTRYSASQQPILSAIWIELI